MKEGVPRIDPEVESDANRAPSPSRARSPSRTRAEFRLAVQGFDHQVGRLEVAVHDPLLVRGVDGRAPRRASAPPSTRWSVQLTSASVGALDQLHRDELVGRVVDRRDVGVGEPRGRLGFAQETLAAPRRSALRRTGEHLQRDAALQHGVEGLVDDAHAASRPISFDGAVLAEVSTVEAFAAPRSAREPTSSSFFESALGGRDAAHDSVSRRTASATPPRARRGPRTVCMTARSQVDPVALLGVGRDGWTRPTASQAVAFSHRYVVELGVRRPGNSRGTRRTRPVSRSRAQLLFELSRGPFQELRSATARPSTSPGSRPVGSGQLDVRRQLGSRAVWIGTNWLPSTAFQACAACARGRPGSSRARASRSPGNARVLGEAASRKPDSSIHRKNAWVQSLASSWVLRPARTHVGVDRASSTFAGERLEGLGGAGRRSHHRPGVHSRMRDQLRAREGPRRSADLGVQGRRLLFLQETSHESRFGTA